MSKLWVVTVEVRALVIADDEYDACQFANEICRDVMLEDESSATEFDGPLPHGWNHDCLVYHDEGGDITVRAAIARHIAEKDVRPAPAEEATCAAAEPSTEQVKPSSFDPGSDR